MNGKKWIKVWIVVVFIPLLFSPLSSLKNIEIKLYKNTENKIIYFSDSIMKAAAVCELDSSGIDILLQNKLNENIVNINNGAYSPIIYSSYIKNIKNAKLIIIPINMRSFSEEWFYKPQYQFYDQRITAEIQSSNFTNAFKIFIQKINDSDKKYTTKRVIRENINIGTIEELKNNKINIDFYCKDKSLILIQDYSKQLREKFTYHYGYKLSNEHKMFEYLNEITKHIKKNNFNVLFYITPINYEYGELLLGNDFHSLIKNNVSIVEDYLNKENVNYINLAFNLKNKNFIDTQHVCEHVDINGREIIAAEIYKYITKQPLPLLTSP